MDKQSLNWLAKEWLKRVAVSGKGAAPFSGQSVFEPQSQKIWSMMDTSKKRIAGPGKALSDQIYSNSAKSFLGDKGRLGALGSHRMNVEDVANLRNEYARIFLTKAMKSKGSIDELAVRQFVKENPKMVEQLLVKNEAIPAGLNTREIASHLSKMYPNGMIKGPVAYERGVAGYAQRQFDKLKDVELMTYPGARGKFLEPNETFGKRITIQGKRSDPVTFLHESDEAKYYDMLPENEKRLSQFFYGPGLTKELLKIKDPTIEKARKIGFEYSSNPANVIGSHISPNVLINERNVMSKIPRYIDPLQSNVGHLREARDFTNEYGAIGSKPLGSRLYDGKTFDFYLTPD
jgi:hypothetical protein